MPQTALFLAFLASLELRRVTTGPANAPLLSIAPGLLLVAMAVVPGSRRAALIALAAVGSFLSTLIVGHDSVPISLVRAGSDVLGACAGAWLLRFRGTDLRAVWTVWDALHIIEAAVLDALVTACVWTVGAAALVPVSALLPLWHQQLVTTLFGISIVVPLAMVFARRRFLRLDLRGVEFTVLLGTIVVTTHFVWIGANYPRPGILAPFLVWAALRHPLESGLVNVTFALTTVATMHWSRSSWTGFGTSSDMLIGLWVYLLVSGAFLVLGTSVLERRRSQHLMHRVLDGVSDGIVVVDARGAVRAMNRSAASMFRLEARRAKGEPIDRWLPSVWSAGAGRAEIDDLEVIAERSDGVRFPVRVSLAPVPADDEQHALIVVRDLSHLRETEHSLAMSEAQWRAVLTALPDLIVITDDTGRCVGAHASPHSSISVGTDQLLGRCAWDVLASEDAASLEVARQKVLNTRLPEVCDARVNWQGQSGWVESRMVPLGSNRTLSVIRDVTERRALQDQVRQSQRLEAIGRLAGGVAHDFNNLLTVIDGSTELVIDSLSPGDPHRRALKEVRDAAARAAQLTQQLLAFGRRQVLQAQVFDVRQVVRDCEPMLRRLIGEHIQLTCQLGEYVPCVRADRGQMEQVLVNLVVNARDAMPTGGQLTIRAEAVDLTEEQRRERQDLPPGRFVALSVTDTGIGIPAAVLEHVFEPFFTTKESGQGTGLGLATVYGIVQQSGGSVTVNSREGVGAAFVIHLPAVAEVVEAPAARPAAITPVPHGDATILLAEDEPSVREVTLRFLTAAGYRVVAAGSGDDALTRLRGHDGAIHLLLTDVVMPGMSGPELATHVQQRHPGARVLFMSGYPDDALRAHHMPEDETTFIQKPFSRQSLLTAVHGALWTSTVSA